MRRLRRPGVTPAGAAVVAVYLGFLGLSLLQQPGRTTYDTRLELTERPGSFLASAFSMWQPDVNLGEMQNQANGYLFPQGPFFWLGHAAGVAPWVTQRVWTALVIIAACEGMRRVGKALDLPVSASFLGGLVFAFSPRLLGTAGVLSAETLPGALAPWALLPVLLAVRGRLAARPAVVLGAAAVVSMGGVNAVETGAALVPVAVFLVWAASRGLASWRLVAGWVGAVVAATLWWTLPLLLLGRYSPPFYEYVESAATTTSLVGWSEAVRGDTHWLAWLVLPDGRAWWPAAYAIATEPVLVGVSAVVAAAGLAGLARWRSPYRVPFAFSAAVGLAVLTVAHGGDAGTPLAGGARSALDSTLQIFRNVHKFDPSVRIAVAVGAAALFAEVASRLDRRWSPGAAARWVIAPACVVLALGTPYLDNNTRTEGWTAIPGSWTSARDWLAERGDGRAALVVPASGFALQHWGATFDEPALALDIGHRVTLTQAPLLPGQSLRFLSELSASITSGSATALVEELARAGIGYLVVRGDLDQTETGTSPPARAEAVLEGAGIDRVVDFGTGTVAPVSIYRVPRREDRLRATPVDDVLTVAGEPESVLALQDAGLAPEGATVFAGEPGWRGSPDVVTDGAQRRERQFGSLYGARSVALQAGEPYRVDRATHDYPGVPHTPQVVASYDGLASLDASSSRGYADTYGEVVLAEGPAAAVDANPATRWVTSPATDPTRQWLRLSFPEPRPVHTVTVQPVVGDPFLVPVRKLEVDAGGQRQTLAVSPGGAAVVARFDGRAVSSVTVRVRQVGVASGLAPVALSTVRVDGLTPRHTLRVPAPLGPGVGFVFQTDAGVRPCVGGALAPDCDESRRRTPEEPAGLDRTVQVRGADTVAVTGTVVARTTRRALRLIEPVGREQRVRASSVFGNDPAVSSRFAWDGAPETAWVPDDADPGPTLVFRWRAARNVTGIRVTSPDPQAAPSRALLTTAEGEHVSVTLGGAAGTSFPRLRTKRLEVTLQRPEPGARLVVGEVRLEGADVTQPFDRTATTGAVCGLGPHVLVDGVVHQSRVVGTLGDIVDGLPLRLTVCDPARTSADGPSEIRLPAGTHRITAPPTIEFQTTMLAGSPGTARPSGAGRSIELRSWHGTTRTAAIGAGPAAIVSMPANANAGWRATLAGKELRSVRVDGWQQGWLLPAGGAGRLEISFPPQAWYRDLVVAGLVPAGLVVLGALVLLLRRPGTVARHAHGRAASNGGAAPNGGPEQGVLRPRTRAALSVLLLVGLGAASAGGALLALVGRRRAWPAGVGGLAVAASGLLDAGDARVPTDGLPDALAAVGFGLLFVTAICRPEEERP